MATSSRLVVEIHFFNQRAQNGADARFDAGKPLQITLPPQDLGVERFTHPRGDHDVVGFLFSSHERNK